MIGPAQDHCSEEIAMKRLSLFAIVISLGISPLMGAQSGLREIPRAEVQDDSFTELVWWVGYAEADITPERGYVQMSGFGRERYAHGALAPLLTQTLILRDRGGRTGVLITADVLDFDRVMVEAIRRAVASRYGIPPENILLAASHTHWGPAIRFQMSFSLGGPNVWYMGFLEDAILANVGTALENLSPATIEYGWIDFREIGSNRRLPTEGEIAWGPNKDGSFDGHTPILSLKRDKTPRHLLVVGHACHPTSSGTIQKWSPDYPGAMRDYLARELSDTKTMFVQGCGGDAKIVHEDPGTGKLVFTADPNRAAAAGKKLAEVVRAHLQTPKMVRLPGELACSLATGQISYGPRWSQEELERQAYPEPAKAGVPRSWQTWAARQSLALPDCSRSFRYDVQVWRLGGRLTLFGMEGEICSPWGPKLRAMAPTDLAMVIGYANSTGSYIPDRQIVTEGGYEGLTSQQAYFLPAPFTENIETEIKQIVRRAMAAIKP
jgi:hypothetical protein